MTAQEIIDQLQLEPLPGEGGFFRRVYTHNATLPASQPLKALASAIYFLLTPEQFSALHRLPNDELFHFYHGDPVEMLQLAPDGTATRYLLGHDLASGQQPMLLAPANHWQGSRILPGGSKGYALLGVSVHPAFDWEDLEIGKRADLLEEYPEHASLINVLTRT